MATLKDIANKVGVSVATVSYALTGRGSVSSDVKAQIKAVAKELGYKPNRSAQAMRTGKTKCLGLVIPDLTNPFYPALAQNIESAARAAGFSVIMVDCQNSLEIEEEGLNILEQQGVDGIIWCPSDSLMLERLAELNCPSVLVDRPHPNFDAVHCDYIQGGALVAEHAIELGHKKVGLLNGPLELESARQRREGFLAAAKGHLEVAWQHEGPFTSTLSDEAKHALCAGDVTLVVAANDLIAVGAIEALQAAGKRVPDDVSIIGFDNIPWSALITPKLTTVNHDVEAIAREAMKVLVGKINTPSKPINTVVLGVNLIERDSAKAI